MRFVVILKQIPDDSIKDEYQDVDQLNDSDKNVIKEALDLRDRYGGTVDVIGFGPLSAEDVMKETLTYGIDDAFLISDPQFADMDVSQVAKIVAAVIKKLGPYDLVLCGRQAIDGDSAHMASMTSCALEIPLIAYSDEITEMKDGSVFATCMGDQMAYKVEAKTPAMILSIREKNKNRFPSVPDIMPLTLELIGAAGKLSKERDLSLSVILSGCGIKEEAKKLYNYGVDEILCIEDEKLIEGHMQLHHDAVIEVLKEKDPKVILIGGTASGRVLAGKTAYAFDTELVCDASKLTYDEKQEQLIITRPAFDGKNMADFLIDPSLTSVITIRTGVMGKAEYKEDKQGEMLYVHPECLKEEQQNLIYHGAAGKSGKEVHLDTARIIVSGGRGMKGEEGFALLERLAEKIGGEVACTRPCVDAGWMLPTQQVGQSGISVKPKLYLAFGIAGAIQHMTGIDADCIISVNNNPRAAIFAYSDYGVVSDAKKLLESMLKQVEEGKEFL